MSTIVEQAKGAGQTIAQGIQNGAQAVGNWLQGAGQTIADTWNNATSSVGNWLQGVGNGIYGILNPTHETNQTNERIADENLTYQKEQDELNRATAQEQTEYDRWLQQMEWQREDTSYQRTAADMRAAGLSPLTMNGTNDSGEVVQSQAYAGNAPQKNYRSDPNQILQNIMGIAGMASQLQNMKLQNEKTMAEITQLNDQTSYVKSVQEYRQASELADAIIKEQAANNAVRDEYILKELGLRQNATTDEVRIALIKQLLGINTKKEVFYKPNPTAPLGITPGIYSYDNGSMHGILKGLKDALPNGGLAEGLKNSIDFLLKYGWGM